MTTNAGRAGRACDAGEEQGEARDDDRNARRSGGRVALALRAQALDHGLRALGSSVADEVADLDERARAFGGVGERGAGALLPGDEERVGSTALPPSGWISKCRCGGVGSASPVLPT